MRDEKKKKGGANYFQGTENSRTGNSDQQKLHGREGGRGKSGRGGGKVVRPRSSSMKKGEQERWGQKKCGQKKKSRKKVNKREKTFFRYPDDEGEWEWV